MPGLPRAHQSQLAFVQGKQLQDWEHKIGRQVCMSTKGGVSTWTEHNLKHDCSHPHLATCRYRFLGLHKAGLLPSSRGSCGARIRM